MKVKVKAKAKAKSACARNCEVQIDLIISTTLQSVISCTLLKMNFMSITDSVGSTNFVIKPTHTDVLLGRGVGTNRHAGNTKFRHIVSQYVVSSRLLCVSMCQSSALLGQLA